MSFCTLSDVDVEKYGDGRRDFKFVRWMTNKLVGVLTHSIILYDGKKLV